MRPATEPVIARRTRSKKEEIAPILLKVAKPTGNTSEWQLLDKSYKELHVWDYHYPLESDRQSAIDHAVRAYDRLRLAQSDPLWQLLLPKLERGKGKILSRLAAHLGPKNNIHSTPRLGPKTADVPNLDGNADVSALDDTNARFGEAMNRSISQEGMKKKKISEREAQSKRLLSKNPKKAQAAFEAKQKKQQEKEAVKSEAKTSKAAKGSMVGKASANAGVAGRQTKHAKSSEFVRESDEEEVELEIAAATSAMKHAETSQPQSQSRKRPAEDVVTTSKSSNLPKKANTEHQPPNPKRRRIEVAQEVQKKTISTDKPVSKASAQSGASKGKAKALNPPTNGASKSRSDISPRKSDTRPEVPSPLGASKPLTASYESGRNPSHVTPDNKGAKKPTAPSPLAQTHSSSSSKSQTDRSARLPTGTSHDKAKVNGHRSSEGTPSDAKRARTISAASSQATTTSDRSNPTPSSTALKRKAADLDNKDHPSTRPPPRKIAKVDTTSHQHMRQASSTTATTSTTTPLDTAPITTGGGATTGINEPTTTTTSSDPPHSATSDEFPTRLTPRQTRRLCEQMSTYYATYAASRAKLQAQPKETRDAGEVADHWRMHNRLLEMKKLIWNADIPRDNDEPKSWGEYEASGRGLVEGGSS